MKPIGKPAFIAAIIGPIQSVLGWVIAGALWAEYNPVTQTITSIYARTLALPGRIALFLSAIATFGLTIYPTPLIGYSVEHRIFAIISFALSAFWPILAMRFRKDAPWIIRPTASIIGTTLQLALAVWFLSTWTDPETTNVGVWERVVTVSQALYGSIVIITIYLGSKRRKPTISR
jgi:hypothetical protein